MLERFYQGLLDFVARKTGCREQARDIVQESYARVLSRYGTQASGTSSELQIARLFVTAKRLLIDRFRRRQYWPDVPVLPEDLLDAGPQHQPEWKLMRQQEARRLLQAIDALPPRCREAFTRFKLDGQSQREIALSMGISVNMVEKHIMRGMLSCKQALDEQGGGHD